MAWWRSWLKALAGAARPAQVAAGNTGAARAGEPTRPAESVSPAPEVNPNAVVWRTPEPPPDPQMGDVWVNSKDGMEMVHVPPGEFILGTSDAQIDAWLEEHPTDERGWLEDERPQCRVNVAGYWIGRTEVTNSQYQRFVQATRHDAPDHYWQGGQVPEDLEDFPVVNVDWDDARAYCAWAGGRLPGELEWEKAARGTGGRVFPWGDAWDAKRCCNLELLTGKPYTNVEASQSALQSWLETHDLIREGPAAVGSYPAGASPYGCQDMAGNGLEWCGDWYEENAYARYATGDLKPPGSGTYRVLRGGSWLFDAPRRFRCARRDRVVPGYRYDNLGFRCVRGLP